MTQLIFQSKGLFLLNELQNQAQQPMEVQPDKMNQDWYMPLFSAIHIL